MRRYRDPFTLDRAGVALALVIVLVPALAACGSDGPAVASGAAGGGAGGAAAGGGVAGVGVGAGGGAAPSCGVTDGAIVDGAPGDWAADPGMPGGPRQETGVVALGDRVVVVGGFTLAEVVGTVEAYEPASGTWSAMPPVPEPLHHANVAVVDGLLYVTGYLTGGQFEESGGVWIYDPAASTWSPGTPMPAGTERGSSAVGVIGSRIFVAGGYRRGAVADVSAYDTRADAWEVLPPLPAPRDHLVGGVVDGVLYAIGGRALGFTDFQDPVLSFDPTLGQWCARSAMPTPRAGSAAAVLDGRIVIAGGEGSGSPTGVFADVDAYDPATDTWTLLTPMATPRHGTGAAVVSGALVVPGGATVQGFGAVATSESLRLR